jgi:universal stress protein A
MFRKTPRRIGISCGVAAVLTCQAFIADYHGLGRLAGRRARSGGRLACQETQVCPIVSRMKDTMTTKKTKKTKAAAAPRLPLRLKSILVPIDFSSSSKKALDQAVAFARQFKAKLTLLHVVEPVATPDFAASFPLAMESDGLIAAAKNELERAVKAARIPSGTVEKILVRCGRSFHEIAEAARTRKVDLIIISTHGYTGVKHALLGSTTERVVRHALCPVLVVRQ